MLVQPTANIPVGVTPVTVTFANQGLYDISSGIQLKSYCVVNRILEGKYVYGGYRLNISNAAALSFNVTSYDSINANIPKGRMIQYLFTIVIPSGGTASPVNANGIIDITFTASYTGYDTFCENEWTSILTELTPGSF